MRILLVNPGDPTDVGADQSGGPVRSVFYRYKLFQRCYFAAPLALPTLAALTPAEHTVEIVDEMIEPIPFDDPVDLVGITAMTYKASRAYHIAREFRARKVPVVLGGIHASMLPDEAAERVDCIVVGEADEIWPGLLDDFEKGQLKPRYRSEAFPDITKIPPPRHDLTSYGRYFSFNVQTTRGCPNPCDFCTVGVFNGKRLRRKSPDQVIREIDGVLRLTRTPLKLINSDNPRDRRKLAAAALMISDDNFAVDRRHALEMCRALHEYQRHNGFFINWFTNVNSRVGFDDELLAALRTAGCYSLFIGFESLTEGTLRSMKKRMNAPSQYSGCIANIRKHGMEVYYSTILGGECDGENAGRELAEFVEGNNVFYVWPNVLTPHPGTNLRSSLEREGRILCRNTDCYDQRNVVFKPALVAPEDLQKMYRDVCARIFRFEKLLERATALLPLPRRLRLTPLWRLSIYAWFLIALSFLLLRRKISFACFRSVLRIAHRFILSNGSLAALDMLVYTLEMDAFARIQSQRERASNAPVGPAASSSASRSPSLLGRADETGPSSTHGSPATGLAARRG